MGAERELSLDQRVLCGTGDATALMLVRVGSDPRHSNLAHFRAYANLRPLPPGSFTAVKRLKDAIHGKIFLGRWNQDGQEDERVVVKKMPNERVRQSANTETSEWNMHLKSHAKYASGE